MGARGALPIASRPGAWLRLTARDAGPRWRTAVVLGWLTVLWLALGGLYGVVQGVPAGDALGVGFIVAIPAAAAVVLALVGRAEAPELG